MSPLEMLGLMLVGHAIADYPLQGDFLAKAKNRRAPMPGVPWYQALGAHAIIHGGFVGIITGSLPWGSPKLSHTQSQTIQSAPAKSVSTGINSSMLQPRSFGVRFIFW